jgi:O-antigen/teichoic acid export membrane protein
VLATGLDLRRQFAGWALVVSIPILAYLLLHHGASWITTALITVSLIPAFYASLSDNLLQIPVKLHQAIIPLQKNQVAVGAGRLVLTAITLFAFPWAFVAIIASGIPRIWGNFRLRKIADGFVDKRQTADEEDRKEIVKIVKKVLPGSIYYAISGQLTIWLISIFGNTASVAQIGALGRIMVLLNFFSILISTLVAPRFSRLPNIKKIILNRFFITLFLIIGTSFLAISCIHIFSNEILYLLGESYENLNYELVLAGIGCCLNLVNGTLFAISSARAYILSPWITIFVNLLFQIILIAILPLNTTSGVLIFSIISNTVVIVMFFTNFIYYSSKITTI